MKKLLVVLVTVLFGVSLTLLADATLLVSGMDTTLTGTTVAAFPNLAGTVVEDELSLFSFTTDTGLVQGNVQSRVVLSNDGTYDFYWRIRDTNGAGLIGSLRTVGFFTEPYDADYRTDGLGDIGPDKAHLFSSGCVNFKFSSGLDTSTGQESYFFFFDTDATNYAKTAKFDLTGTGLGEISGFFDTFAPAPVPIPGAIWLLGSGLLGLVGIRRKKS